MVPIPQELVNARSFLTEIESRSRDRIPFPQIGWPANIEHPRLDDRLLAEVQRGILAGQTMQMMKLVQEVTGIRSKECLDLVEKLNARLLRCNPYGTSGIDNVPLAAPPGARWYLPWRYARWRGVNAP